MFLSILFLNILKFNLIFIFDNLDFRIIPDEIEKLKNLTYLDISSNTLGE